MLIKETIDEFEFISKKKYYNGYSKSTIQNLMRGKPYSLLSIYNEDELVMDELRDSIKASVENYIRNKDNAINIYKKYIEFLKKYNFNINIDFPPIPVSITFERIMFIAKHIQNPDNKISDLADTLWVSNRTIEHDIAILKGNTSDPIQVNGKKFVIKDIERNSGKVSMSSTAHPIFLTSNITQIIITLKGLKSMSQNSAFKDYAEQMASSIWAQLSDYAKNRILYVMENLIIDELDWYKSLDKNSTESFYNEIKCSNTEGMGCVLDCLKNGKECFIEYKNGEKVTFYKNCKIVKYLCETIRIDCKGQITELNLSNILRSSYTLEELI